MKHAWIRQQVDCNLCQRNDAAILFRQDQHGLGLHTVMCRHCGLIYLNPRPTENDYAEFYRHWYHRWYPSRAAFNSCALGNRITTQAAQRRCEIYAPFLRGEIRLLEIGPGEGAFLSAMRALRPDCETRGVDLSPAEVDSCRKKGLDVVQGSVHELSTPYAGNTHIALFHVLEHALDPVGLLRQAAARLRPGGVMFIEVPNILGSWRGLGMLHMAHPYQFAAATLQRGLRCVGLEIVQLDELEDPLFPSSLRAVAKLSAASAFHPLPAMPSVEQIQSLFARKLLGWRRELLLGGVRRGLCRLVGPHYAARLWERTAGREWKQALDGH